MKKILLTGIMICAAFSASAQVADKIEEGQTAFGFCVVDPSPASAGKAFTGLASVSDAAWASFGNIASLPFSDGRGAFAAGYQSVTPRSTATTGYAVSGAFLIGNGAVAAGARMQNGESYTELDAHGNPLDEFTPNDMQINVGYALSFAGNFAAGVNAHYLSSSIADGASMSSFAADLSFFGRFGSLNASAGLRNLGTSVKDSDGNSFSIPANVFAAGEYGIRAGDKAYIKADADFAYYLSGGMTVGAGLEGELFDILTIRAGASYGSEIMPTVVSAGIGVKFAGLSLDAAYIFAGENIGGTLMAGLGYSF